MGQFLQDGEKGQKLAFFSFFFILGDNGAMPHFDHFPRPGEIDPYVKGFG